MNIQWKIVMGNDYFPCFKFCTLLTFRRGRRTWQERNYRLSELGKKYTMENIMGSL